MTGKYVYFSTDTKRKKKMTTEKQRSYISKLIDSKEKMLESDHCLQFSTEELSKLDKTKTKKIEEHFHGRAMMKPT